MSSIHEPVRSEFGCARLRELLGVRPDPVAWIEWVAHEAEDLLRDPDLDVTPEIRADRLLISLARLERCDASLLAIAGAAEVRDELRARLVPELRPRLAAAVAALEPERWFDAVEILREMQESSEDGHTIDPTIDLLMSLDDADLLVSWAISQEVADMAAWEPLVRAEEYIAEHGPLFMEAGPWLLSMTAAIGEEIPEELECTVGKFVDWLVAIEEAWEAAEPGIAVPIPGLFERLATIGAGTRRVRPLAQLLGDWLTVARPAPALAAATGGADQPGPALTFREPSGDCVARLYLTGGPDAAGSVEPAVRIDGTPQLAGRELRQVRFGSLAAPLVRGTDGRYRATLPRIDARQWLAECAAAEPQLIVDERAWPRTA